MAKIDIAFGFSKRISAEEAVREASIQIRSKFALPKIEYCIVLFNLSADEAKQLSYHIKRTLNPHTVIGCACPYLIADQNVFKKGIVIIGFSGLTVSTQIFTPSANILESSEKFVWRILRDAQGQRREFFLNFLKLDSQSATDFLKGIERGLGRNFPFLSTFSSEENSLFPFFALYNENIFNSGSIGMLFSGNLEVFLEIKSGFIPLGKGGRITSSNKNVISEIDDKPAVHFYKDYLGEKIVHSAAYFRKATTRYPLGFRIGQSQEYIVVSPLQLKSDGSLVFLKDIDFQDVKIMIPTRDSLIDSLKKSAQNAQNQMRRPRIALLFDSFFRHKFLGLFYYRQLKILKQTLGSIPLVGGISYYNMGTISSSKIGLGHTICENSFSFILLGEK